MHERRYRAHQTKARKQETREKILLGGLVVKAGLRATDKAVLLGALLDAADRLQDARLRENFAARGKEAFDNDRIKNASAGSPATDDGRSPVGDERD
ncbi:MAG: conjugal transfer protein TraD [Pseudorhizobium sp.]